MHFDRRDLILEFARCLRRRKALLRSQRPTVLHLACDLTGFCEILGVPARMFAGERIVQPVPQHAVVKLPIAQPVAPTPACREVGRPIHVFHAARHRAVRQPEHDVLGGRHDGLRARAADAVDSHRRDVDWKSTIHGRLPGRVHLVAGLDDISHNGGIHIRTLEFRTLQHGSHNRGAQFGRGHGLEAAVEGADSGSNRVTQDDLTPNHNLNSRSLPRAGHSRSPPSTSRIRPV